jgi:5-carboxymethyl-2-hydroxymuconate isomerase
MPQMFIDYSDNIQNLDQKKLMLGLNHALFDTGLVSDAHDIKSRIQSVSDYLIGFGDNQQAFIFVRLQGLSGRSEEQKNLMTENLSQFLQSCQYDSAQGVVNKLCVVFSVIALENYN